MIEKPETEKSIYGKKAKALFREGYNCAQSVFLAFSDQYELPLEAALKISSSFGAGMGRLREVCGAVSGMFMTAGILYGYTDPEAYEEKAEHYKRIQQLAGEFESVNKAIVCRKLLGLPDGKDDARPLKRTEEYYKKRPCEELIGMAACIMEAYIKEHPIEKKMSGHSGSACEKQFSDTL